MHRVFIASGVIRKLWDIETDAYCDHLLRLDPQSRRNRFSGSIADEAIRSFAATARGPDVVVHGFFVDGVLRGAADLTRDFVIDIARLWTVFHGVIYLITENHNSRLRHGERYYICPVAISRRLLIERGGAMLCEYRCECGASWAREEEEPIISALLQSPPIQLPQLRPGKERNSRGLRHDQQQSQ